MKLDLENKIKELIKLDKGKHEDYVEFILQQLDKHIKELYELHKNNNPHFLKETADVYILARMLMLEKDVDDKILKERLVKFRDKILGN